MLRAFTAALLLLILWPCARAEATIGLLRAILGTDRVYQPIYYPVPVASPLPMDYGGGGYMPPYGGYSPSPYGGGYYPGGYRRPYYQPPWWYRRPQPRPWGYDPYYYPRPYGGGYGGYCPDCLYESEGKEEESILRQTWKAKRDSSGWGEATCQYPPGAPEERRHDDYYPKPSWLRDLPRPVPLRADRMIILNRPQWAPRGGERARTMPYPPPSGAPMTMPGAYGYGRGNGGGGNGGGAPRSPRGQGCDCPSDCECGYLETGYCPCKTRINPRTIRAEIRLEMPPPRLIERYHPSYTPPRYNGGGGGGNPAYYGAPPPPAAPRGYSPSPYGGAPSYPAPWDMRPAPRNGGGCGPGGCPPGG